MKITSAALRVFESAVNSWSWNFNRGINLYKVEHYGADSILEYAVNWAGMGGKSPEETYSFIDNLKTAARVCDAINQEHYEVVNEKLETVFPTEEDYDAAVEALAENLRDCRPARIIRWLDDHCIE